MAGSFRRVVLLVADGLGVGEMPDAAFYGDAGADTLAHVCGAVGGLKLPNLEKLGLGGLGTFSGISKTANPQAACARLAEKSAGKDTTTGHWEIAGLVTREAFPLFPSGFSAELVASFVSVAGVPGVLGNKPASGTAILDELGEEHIQTGKPILYTSGDSVFQLACHEKYFGLERLYRVCEAARRVTLPYRIGRVIARPFVGEKKGAFKRTERRRDYALTPGKNLLDTVSQAGVAVCSVGKIEDIFDHRGIQQANHTGNNADSLSATLDFLEKFKRERALVFTNLVDFDMLFGHRRDPQGYARALVDLDAFLPSLLGRLESDDLLILTGDHGCDPTFKGSDHTREFVPLIAYSPSGHGAYLGDRDSFADIAATLLEGFGILSSADSNGQSFLCSIQKSSEKSATAKS